MAPIRVSLLVLASLVFSGQAARFASQQHTVDVKLGDGDGPDPPPTVYKTTKPLIGILTQPCHDCPGK